nr:uncharacterized protein LOC107177859 [Ipomoea trifida]
MNAVVQPQVQGILGPSPDTHLQPSMQTENGQGTQRSVQTENGQGTQRFHIKLELPRFDGSDPHGWAFRIQEYFYFYDTPDAQRLRIAGFTMEGKASEWYQWMKKNRLLTTWKEFLQNVTKRFGESRFEDFQGKLSKLTQQTTVTAYQAEFERLMNKVTGIAEPILLSMVPSQSAFLVRVWTATSSFLRVVVLVRFLALHEAMVDGGGRGRAKQWAPQSRGSALGPFLLAWRDSKNKIDCGVFLMRHMETYLGQGVKKLDYGLVTGDTSELHKLRMRFMKELSISE